MSSVKMPDAQLMLDQIVSAVRSRTVNIVPWGSGRSPTRGGDEQLAETLTASDGDELTSLMARYRNRLQVERRGDGVIRVILPEEAESDGETDEHRRNNREEIRRKLAMGSDNDDYYGGERMSRKPSLQSRLQSGMNLQICFMNETVPDQDGSTVAEDDAFAKRKQLGAMPEKEKSVLHSSAAPGLSSPGTPEKENLAGPVPLEEATDILSKQAKLQAEARLALAQAKQMAHMQMEIEKQRKKKSPIAEMVGIPFPDGRHKVSRQALSEMNVAQLQVIVNDLHTQIENLNEELVRLLLERDDLHMEQDSMLVDIEDLTRYL